MSTDRLDPRLRDAEHAIVEHLDLESIGDALHRLTRTIQRRKAQLAAEGEDSEWAAHILLEQIAATGPMRAAHLAECTFTDPSTVSRHVASLVRTGLVERRADPIDGRASLLVATEAGLSIVEEHRARRREWLCELLDDWDPQDCQELGRLMDKFTLALESQSPAPAPASEGTR
jgi:DNA-binding MarR family transcriptional regulator